MTILGNGIGKTSYVESCLCIAFTLFVRLSFPLPGSLAAFPGAYLAAQPTVAVY